MFPLLTLSKTGTDSQPCSLSAYQLQPSSTLCPRDQIFDEVSKTKQIGSETTPATHETFEAHPTHDGEFCEKVDAYVTLGRQTRADAFSAFPLCPKLSAVWVSLLGRNLCHHHALAQSCWKLRVLLSVGPQIKISCTLFSGRICS